MPSVFHSTHRPAGAWGAFAQRLRAAATRLRGDMPLLIWVLAAGGMVSSIGSSFTWPLSTIYVHKVLGESLTVAGLVLMLQAGAGLVGQLLGGALHDRLGAGPVMLGSLLGASLALVILGLVRLLPAYAAAMVVAGLSYGMLDPATNALVGSAWPAGGRRGFNFLYVARNAGVAIGTAVGGLVAQRSFTLSFLLNAALVLVYAAMVARYVPRARPQAAALAASPASQHTTAPATSATPTASAALTTPASPAVMKRGESEGMATAGAFARRSIGLAWPIGALTLGTALLWAAYSQWQATVSVYMQSLGYSLAAYSLLWTVNGLEIVGLQPLAQQVVRRWLRSLQAQMGAGTLLFAAAFALVWQRPVYAGFATGMVILTFGEMLVLPALPAAVARVAPPGKQGRLQGIVGGGMSAGRMLGPVLGGALYDRWSPQGILAAAAVACLVATGSLVLYGFDPTGARRRSPPSPAEG